MAGDNERQNRGGLPYEYFTEQKSRERKVVEGFLERVIAAGVELSDDQSQLLGVTFQQYVVGHLPEIVEIYT